MLATLVKTLFGLLARIKVRYFPSANMKGWTYVRTLLDFSGLRQFYVYYKT